LPAAESPGAGCDAASPRDPSGDRPQASPDLRNVHLTTFRAWQALSGRHPRPVSSTGFFDMRPRSQYATSDARLSRCAIHAPLPQSRLLR
jgi:hypothetical protein